MTSVELLEKFNITPQDTANVRRAGDILAPQLELFVEQWYVWLRQQPEYLQFFPDNDNVGRVSKMQTRHWQEFRGGGHRGILAKPDHSDRLCDYRVAVRRRHAQEHRGCL